MDVRPPRDGAKGEGPSAEVLDDRMKELSWETEEMAKMKSADTVVNVDHDGSSAPISTKHGSTDCSADTECVSKKQKKEMIKKTKEPTREHFLIQEKFQVAREWEKEMPAKHTEGQAAEIMGRIFDNRKKDQFPSEVPHNWTTELMEETKIGWQKCKEYYEVMDKYPRQNMEQFFKEDTEEWIIRDLAF